LREWCYEKEAKRGSKRTEVNVKECFADLCRWALDGWEGEKKLVLAIDATSNGEHFTVLDISIVSRSCAIPVAWHLTMANEPGAWKPFWLDLLEALGATIGDNWKVIVMTDQGLYAAWLYQQIVALGWFPMMRVSERMGTRVQAEEDWTAIGQRVGRRGRKWQAQGEWSEQGERMSGTMLVRWEPGYEHKLAVVTALPVEQAQAAWYQMRFWTEGGFKDQKRGLLGWEQTKMHDPGRASRLWLAMAVAMLWMVRVGSEEEGREEEAKQARSRKATGRKGKRGRPARQYQRPRGREQSCIVRGMQTIQTAIEAADPLPLGHGVSEAWPRQFYAARHPASSWVKKRKRKEERRRQRQQGQRTEARARRVEQRQEKEAHQQAEREAKRQERHRQQAGRAKEREVKRQEREARQQAQLRRQAEQEQEREANVRQRARNQLARANLQQRRQLWHEEVAQKRQERLARQQERLARQAKGKPASSSTVSRKFPPPGTLTPLPQPP
jgi:hypothetical protein